MRVMILFFSVPKMFFHDVGKCMCSTCFSENVIKQLCECNVIDWMLFSKKKIEMFTFTCFDICFVFHDFLSASTLSYFVCDVFLNNFELQSVNCKSKVSKVKLLSYTHLPVNNKNITADCMLHTCTRIFSRLQHHTHHAQEVPLH